MSNEYILKETVLNYLKYHSAFKNKSEIMQDIAECEPAGVVQVVRCKDCARYLDLRHWCKCHDTTMFENDFCSYGVREG